MALAGVGFAFSVGTTGVFMYQTISGLIKPNPNKATVVAISVGSTGIQGNSDGMGGNIPNVAVYAEDGTEIGRTYGSNKHTWAAGSTNFVSINPNKGMDGVQATYVSVGTGGNDAICISAVSVAWPDGSTPKVWLGDIGANCSTSENGWAPYSSISHTGTGSDPKFQSQCIWIDGDGTNGIPSQGFSLHITDFGRTDGAYTSNGDVTSNPVADQWSANNSLLCNAPGRMNFYKGFLPDDYPTIYQPPLEYNTDGTDVDPNAILNGGCDDDPELLNTPCAQRQSRKSKRMPQFTQHPRGWNQSSDSTSSIAHTIVHSNSSAHSAEKVCTHPGSLGPSLVSSYEGKFCDMVTRIVWPLCSDTITSACFDANSNKLVLDQKRLNGTHINLVNPGNGSHAQIVYW